MIDILNNPYQNETVEEKRKRRKEKRLDIQRLKKDTYERKQIEANDTKSTITNKISELELNLSVIQDKIKEYSIVKDYNKVNYFKNIKKELVYKIATYKVNLIKLDETFIKRNMIRLKLCAKTEKGKECKYEECLFAHSVNDIRKPKCINHMFNICKFGSMCIHDHSNTELPEIPIKKEETLVEDNTLQPNTNSNNYKYVTIINNISIYTDENSIELQKIKNHLNTIQI